MRMRNWISGNIVVNSIIVLSLLSCNSEDSRTGQPQENSEPQTTVSTELEYTAHPDWIEEQPASSMRKAQYRLPGREGAGDAEMAVFFFPGTGGSVRANLDRWYGQFKQPDGSETSSHAEENMRTVNNLEVTIVYVTGTYLQSTSPMMMGGAVEEKPDYAMLAAIAGTSGGPWFFKVTGPQKTIDGWRNEFVQFTESFSIPE